MLIILRLLPFLPDIFEVRLSPDMGDSLAPHVLRLLSFVMEAEKIREQFIAEMKEDPIPKIRLERIELEEGWVHLRGNQVFLVFLADGTEERIAERELLLKEEELFERERALIAIEDGALETRKKDLPCEY